MFPIVSSSKDANACQHIAKRSPKHVNVLYEGGEVATHQYNCAFQVGAGHIQGIPR